MADRPREGWETEYHGDQIHHLLGQVAIELEQIRSQAEEFAGIVLEAFWGDSFPVDANRIVAEFPIHIRYVDFPGETAGLIIKPAELLYPTVFLDRDMTLQRRRFTIAHLLGHYIDHFYIKEAPNDAPMSYDDPEMAGVNYHSARLPKFSKDPDTRRSELFADAFAYALLMPRRKVESFVDLEMTRSEVAAYFDVSPVMMASRLKELNVDLQYEYDDEYDI